MGEIDGAPEPKHVDQALSKDELLKFIELDLWSRFQERLWKIVGSVLAAITIVGLLGVPYYIKSEVNQRLQQREKDLEDRSDEIIACAKLLSMTTAQYDSARYRLDTDVLRLVAALNQIDKSDSKSKPRSRFDDPSKGLVALISNPDFSQVVKGSFMLRSAFSVPDAMKDKQVVPETWITVENSGPSGSGGYQQIHPIRNGTYEGCIRDLRYQIVVLEGLRHSIERLRERILQLGGATELEKRVEVVRVDSLQATVFVDAFANGIESNASAFLTDKEQREFAKLQGLYSLGYKTTYVGPSELPSPDQKSSPSKRK